MKSDPYKDPDAADLSFAFECKRTWDSLYPTRKRTVRHCSECNRDVYLVWTKKQALMNAKHHRCVAVAEQQQDDRAVVMQLLLPRRPECEPLTPGTMVGVKVMGRIDVYESERRLAERSRRRAVAVGFGIALLAVVGIFALVAMIAACGGCLR